MLLTLGARRRNVNVNVDEYRGFGPLTKQGVVLGLGPAAFDANMVESPVVWWDQSEGQWGMVYTGYSAASQGSVGIAWSPDLLTWTKAGQILAPTGVPGDPDQGGITGPYMRYEDGTYYLFYIGLTEVGYESGVKSLCLATASSSTGQWTRHGTVIAPLAGPWRAGAIYHASIVLVDSTYYMFFNASASIETIGYATASSLLGPWTVDDVNSPVVTVSASGWDSGWVGDPSIYKVGTTWYMAYYGYGDGTARDGIATTTEAAFPLGWVKYAGNPVLSPSETYDSTYAHKPFIVNHEGRHYHYYTAVGSAGRVIALAVDPAIP